MLTRFLSASLVLMFVLAFIWEGLSFGFGLEVTLAAGFTAGLLAAEVVRRIIGGDKGGGPSIDDGPQHPVLS
ncbi:hypothetical protein [Amycolatopsis sp. CA-128772]|uniref:hypothetical protein n=1 Tax=Amycolatopsis sp. CA-128772 TaxID=2073159 RepID=UPI0011B00043|nr:hypothetical protein [Amycolatopsis sp. CA-128772]